MGSKVNGESKALLCVSCERVAFYSIKTMESCRLNIYFSSYSVFFSYLFLFNIQEIKIHSHKTGKQTSTMNVLKKSNDRE